MSRLVGLYPGPWRERYEAEFRELIAERPPTFADRIDIARGALDERLRPQVPGPERTPDRVGFGPLVGFALLAGAVLIMANGPVRYDEYGMYRDGALALPLVIISLILLSIGLHRVVNRLPAEATVPRAAGWAAIIAGPIWALMPWVMPIGLVFLVGVLGLAVGARTARIWPAWSEVVLVAALVVPAGLFLALPFLPWYTMRVLEVNLLIVVGPMSLVWLVVGGLLLRGSPRAAMT
ncbi:MAG: hypothetical protein AABZ33_13895 [Chloroflexota bacterium]